MNSFLRFPFWLTPGLFLMVPVASMSQTAFETSQALIGSKGGTQDHDIQSDAVSGIGLPQVTLDDLVSAALSRNPAIKSASERYKAEQARAPQARSLPDPMFSGGWMGNITPFSIQNGDPSSYRQFRSARNLRWSDREDTLPE